jgi:hypothetical protein
VKDKSKVAQSVSHYRWLARDVAPENADGNPKVPVPPLKLDSKNRFHLKTCDGIEYTFDAATGKISETKTP